MDNLLLKIVEHIELILDGQKVLKLEESYTKCFHVKIMLTIAKLRTKLDLFKILRTNNAGEGKTMEKLNCSGIY